MMAFTDPSGRVVCKGVVPSYVWARDGEKLYVAPTEWMVRKLRQAGLKVRLRYEATLPLGRLEEGPYRDEEEGEVWWVWWAEDVTDVLTSPLYAHEVYMMGEGEDDDADDDDDDLQEAMLAFTYDDTEVGRAGFTIPESGSSTHGKHTHTVLPLGDVDEGDGEEAADGDGDEGDSSGEVAGAATAGRGVAGGKRSARDAGVPPLRLSYDDGGDEEDDGEGEGNTSARMAGCVRVEQRGDGPSKGKRRGIDGGGSGPSDYEANRET